MREELVFGVFDEVKEEEVKEEEVKEGWSRGWGG